MSFTTFEKSGQYNSWWTRHSVQTNHTSLWQLGPLKLWAQRLPHLWRLSWKHSSRWLDGGMRIIPDSDFGQGLELPPLDAQQVNCAFGASDYNHLLFTPCLPDRPVVTRLETPLNILPGETVSLYVISPLRLRIELDGTAKLLQEIPTYRLSDTWFGPMSSAGELCYASTVPAFLSLAEVPLLLHCAISAVTIRNSGADSLRLDRINVPLPKLSLFYATRTGFWTDAFSLERKEDSEMASLKLDRQPPFEASPSEFVAGPRHIGAESNSVVRAFSALFRDRSTL